MQPGSTFAHYSVVDKIGAGGMGEVFRATDTKLRRDVALKVLPAEFANDPERLARFKREARTLASLQHPNVASIYGIESLDDSVFLVMELVVGVDLAQRLQQGPLPQAETLEIAVQVAAGLESAHDRGIVHRDLKPANVMLTPDGQVKILDFGLARAYQGDDIGEEEISSTPTMTHAMTGPGVVLGTAAYMSPEQARGNSVDRRTDIWAFGCLLFELLTGVRAFAGDTASDILASVLKSDPPWDALPDDTPSTLVRLLYRCLEKDPRRRLHDVADARIEIEDLQAGRSLVPEEYAATTSTSGPSRPRWLMPAVAVAALAIGLFAGNRSVTPEPPAPEPVRRLAFEAENFVPRTDIAIAPDGSSFVYPARTENAVWALMIRHLDQFESQILAGTEFGINPFFSPDGKWIVFGRDGNALKIPARGGPTQHLCSARGDLDGYWAPDGFIYVSGIFDVSDDLPSICRIPEGGGTPELVLKSSGPDETFFDPFLVPGTSTLLFSEVKRGQRVAALDLATGQRHVVMEGAGYPVYTASGHLVYLDASVDRLLSIPFDTKTATVSGSPTGLLEEVNYAAAAPTGMVIFAPNTINDEDIVVKVERDGTWSPLLEERSSWAQPRIAPDGGSILLRKTASPNCFLWRYDLGRQILSRVTFEQDSHDAFWSPDGRNIAFCATGQQTRALCIMPVDGSGPARPLMDRANPQSSCAWSPTGEYIVFTETTPSTGTDLWYIDPNDPDAEPQVFLQTNFAEDNARFSPDGKWIAHTSDESGRQEVYLRPFPGPGGKIQISREGGAGPLWAPDGSELFFSSQDFLMVVDVSAGDPLQVSAPRELFEGDFAFERVGNYDITSDGQSFVIVRTSSENVGRKEFRVITDAMVEMTP